MSNCEASFIALCYWPIKWRLRLFLDACIPLPLPKNAPRTFGNCRRLGVPKISENTMLNDYKLLPGVVVLVAGVSPLIFRLEIMRRDCMRALPLVKTEWCTVPGEVSGFPCRFRLFGPLRVRPALRERAPWGYVCQSGPAPALHRSWSRLTSPAAFSGSAHHPVLQDQHF